jgi:HD-GYP domain-containing protein (c-di-GMP phosphodiesterase class II)
MVEKVKPRAVLAATIAPQAASYLGYGMFGLLLAVLWDGVGIGPFAVILVLLPLYVAKWAYAQYAEQQLAYDRTIQTLVQAVETKDLYTRGHSERVATASVMIARQIKMHEDRVSVLRYAGILHDVGKLGVPTRVLQKSGRLTDEEYEAIKLHPVRGLEVVRQIEFLGEAYAGIMHHHERIDGRGYPMGLQGDQIPEFARVIAVADAFDSMTTTRSYRDARPIEDAIAELHRCAGTQFDPVMVEAMVHAVEAEEWAPEVPPVPVADDDAEGFDYDHDDPTVTIGPGSAEGGSGR